MALPKTKAGTGERAGSSPYRLILPPYAGLIASPSGEAVITDWHDRNAPRRSLAGTRAEAYAASKPSFVPEAPPVQTVPAVVTQAAAPIAPLKPPRMLLSARMVRESGRGPVATLNQMALLQSSRPFVQTATLRHTRAEPSARVIPSPWDEIFAEEDNPPASTDRVSPPVQPASTPTRAPADPVTLTPIRLRGSTSEEVPDQQIRLNYMPSDTQSVVEAAPAKVELIALASLKTAEPSASGGAYFGESYWTDPLLP